MPLAKKHPHCKILTMSGEKTPLDHSPGDLYSIPVLFTKRNREMPFRTPPCYHNRENNQSTITRTVSDCPSGRITCMR